MPTNDQVSEEVVSLADEELIDHLRSGNLTEVAADIVRQELAARDIDVASALAQSAQGAPPPLRISVATRGRFVAFLGRASRFPLRAVLGAEPLWAVIVFGGILFFLLFKLIVYGLTQLLAVRPMPPYALPLAYAAMALIALAMTWFALGLWRSARRAKSSFWKIAGRVLAVLVALNAVFGTLGGMRVMQKYFNSPPASVMDSIPKQ